MPRRRPQLGPVLGVTLGVLLVTVRSEPSAAQEATTSVPRRPTVATVVDVGVIALPFASAQPFADAEEEPGEAALGAGVHILGRLGDYGFGAGFNYGLGFRTTEAPGNSRLAREHSRLYYMLDGVFRYYLPPFAKDVVWWFGASGGLVVVNDTWTNLADRSPPTDIATVGLTATRILSEGFMAGLELGAHHVLFDRWLIGGRIRYSNWVIPGPREFTPFRDRASLGGDLEPLGRIDVIETGVLFGFELGG